jgi:hypothetical protein
MEAPNKGVVGWLQRGALWLAGMPMLLQIRTNINKMNRPARECVVFVATHQAIKRSGEHMRIAGTGKGVMLLCSKNYQADVNYQFELFIVLNYDSSSPRYGSGAPQTSGSALEVFQPQPQP